jgi:DNA-directed RNA polymerase subunit F
MTEKEYIDFASVRDLLIDAQARRGELSWEQVLALQHAEWAASQSRGGIVTNAKVFGELKASLSEIEKLAEQPDICAKIAELMPMNVAHVRAVLATKRIAMETEEIEVIITLVRQHVL